MNQLTFPSWACRRSFLDKTLRAWKVLFGVSVWFVLSRLLYKRSGSTWRPPWRGPASSVDEKGWLWGDEDITLVFCFFVCFWWFYSNVWYSMFATFCLFKFFHAGLLRRKQMYEWDVCVKVSVYVWSQSVLTELDQSQISLSVALKPLFTVPFFLWGGVSYFSIMYICFSSILVSLVFKIICFMVNLCGKFLNHM